MSRAQKEQPEQNKTCLATQPTNDHLTFFVFRKDMLGPPKSTNTGYRMHNSELRWHLNYAFDKPCFLHMGNNIPFCFTSPTHIYIYISINIFSFIWIYIYIYMYTYIYILTIFSKKVEIQFWICSYIENLTQNLIETFKTSIYSTKHTNNTKLHFRHSHICFAKMHILQKLDVQKHQRFVLICMVLLRF